MNSKNRYVTRKALTQTQTIAIVAIIVVVAIGGFLLYKPEPENQSPSAIATVSDTIAAINDALAFSAGESSDPDNNIDTYAWNFGDDKTGSGLTISHSYSLPGRYIISLVVTDEENAQDTNDDDLIFIDVSRESLIPVLTSPPQAKIAASDDVITIGETVSFDGVSSSGWYERRGVVTPIGTDIISWEWDFGDGTTDSGTEVTKTFNAEGNFAVTLTVKSEGTGKSDSVMRTIHVTETEIERPDVKNPDTYIFASAITSRVLDPVECTGASNRMALVVLTEGLVWYPPGKSTIEPRIAESYDISDDGKTYTFYLKEGINFWNGDELTAEDVEYTFQRFMAMNLPASWCDRLNLPLVQIGTGERISEELIEGALEVVDDHTFKFHLPKAYAPFIDTLALPLCGIISKDYAIERGSYQFGQDWLGRRDPNMQIGDALMGTGPYKLVQFVPNERTIFERNDDYWGEPAKIKRVIWLDIVEWSTRQTMILAGDIDATDCEASQIAVIEENPGIEVLSMKHGMVENLYFGFDRDMELQPVGAKHRPDIMNDIHMRRGMAYAFPYEDYFEQAWLGMIEPAYSNIEPGFLGYFPYQEDLTYDPARAEEEFRQAWDGEVWEEGFTLAFGFQPWMSEGGIIMGNLLQESLHKINPKFDLIITQASWPTLLYYPLYPAWAQSGPDPMWYNYNWRSKYGLFADFAKYVNTDLDIILDEALLESDPVKRTALYKQATDIMKEDVAMLHIGFAPTFYVYKDWLGNIEDSWQSAWYVDSPYFATVEK